MLLACLIIVLGSLLALTLSTMLGALVVVLAFIGLIWNSTRAILEELGR